MQEEYFKKTELSALFTNALKANPTQKEFLIKLWGDIKALNPVSAEPSGSKNSEKCGKCKLKQQCDMIDDVKKLFEDYHDIKEEDAYWHNLVTSSTDLIGKYERHRFIEGMVQCVMNELDKVSRDV